MKAILGYVEKKLKLRRVSAISTIIDILLVYDEFKCSYLVDTCSMTSEQAYDLWQYIGGLLQIDIEKVGIISIGEDIFFVNVSRLLTNYSHILRNAAENIEYCILVDLDQTEKFVVHHMDNDELSLLRHFLSILELVNNGNIYVQLVSHDSPLHIKFGGPALAGILLGYPIIYLARPAHSSNSLSSSSDFTGQYTNASERLSFTNLIKHSCKVLIDVASCHPTLQELLRALPREYFTINGHREGNKTDYIQWTISEFTYPEELLREQQQLIELTMDRFQEEFTAKINTVVVGKSRKETESHKTLITLSNGFIDRQAIATGAISL